jgi:hypothetical protein
MYDNPRDERLKLCNEKNKYDNHSNWMRMKCLAFKYIWNASCVKEDLPWAFKIKIVERDTKWSCCGSVFRSTGCIKNINAIYT